MTIAPEIGHPLFPPDDDDARGGDDGEPVQVSQIQVTRMENGQPVFAPRIRPATELLSLEQIAGEFGGGTYILIARNEGRITSRRKYVIPGKPKPLFDEAKDESPTQVVPPAPVIDPMRAMMGGEGGLMGLIMMMMQQMMQQQAAAAASQTQMFIAMMQGNQQSSAEEKAQARAELQANIERERISSERTMGLMREMMQARGGGGSEDFTKGVEFMRAFAHQQIEVMKSQVKGDDTDWGSVLETVGQAIQGLQMFSAVKSGGLPEGVAAAATEAAQ